MKSNLKVFIHLSVELTGISKEILAPAITSYDLPKHYYEECLNKFGERFDHFIERCADIQDVEIILADPVLGEIAQQITFLWYMGAWAVENPFGVQTRIVDAISYQKGMAWQVMQSHAMGYSTSRYGYWAHKPADLDVYIGKDNTSKKEGN